MTAPTHTARVPGATSVIARTVCDRERKRSELVPHGQATCNDCYPRTVTIPTAGVITLASAPTETPAQCPHCGTAFDPPVAGGITPHTEYDCSECEGPVCWSCMDRVGDCPKCAETPSLTTEQARGLASRWAWWEAKKAEQPESWMYISAGPAPLLDTDERQLFAWVRAWMAERKRAGNLDACIGEALGLDDIDAAHALAHEATKAGPS